MDPLWQNIVTALEVPSEVADKWLAKLKQQYSQPIRHYHNEEQMLRRKVEHITGSSICLQLAVLFQYYNFDVGKDCVQENCDALKEFLTEAKIDNKALENNTLRLLGDVSVESYDLPDDDVVYFQDLDLLILGYPPEDYKLYTDQLRKEYHSMETSSYTKMRLKILQTFSRISFIYSTNQFGDKYEKTARDNIEKEIKELENQ